MKQKKKPSLRRRILRLLAALVLVWAVLFSGLWIWGLAEGRGGEADVMIVLGSNVLPNGEPNTVLEARLREALARYQADPLPIVCCGAQGPDEPMSEAQCMFNNLTEAGITADRVIMEDRATNTDENIRYSLSLIREKELNPDIAVVTDSYHQLRARIILHKTDSQVKAGAINARNNQIGLLTYPTYFVREWIAIPVELIK